MTFKKYSSDIQTGTGLVKEEIHFIDIQTGICKKIEQWVEECLFNRFRQMDMNRWMDKLNGRH